MLFYDIVLSFFFVTVQFDHQRYVLRHYWLSFRRNLLVDEVQPVYYPRISDNMQSAWLYSNRYQLMMMWQLPKGRIQTRRTSSFSESVATENFAEQPFLNLQYQFRSIIELSIPCEISLSLNKFYQIRYSIDHSYNFCVWFLVFFFLSYRKTF